MGLRSFVANIAFFLIFVGFFRFLFVSLMYLENKSIQREVTIKKTKQSKKKKNKKTKNKKKKKKVTQSSVLTKFRHKTSKQVTQF